MRPIRGRGAAAEQRELPRKKQRLAIQQSGGRYAGKEEGIRTARKSGRKHHAYL